MCIICKNKQQIPQQFSLKLTAQAFLSIHLEISVVCCVHGSSTIVHARPTAQGASKSYARDQSAAHLQDVCTMHGIVERYRFVVARFYLPEEARHLCTVQGRDTLPADTWIIFVGITMKSSLAF